MLSDLVIGTFIGLSRRDQMVNAQPAELMAGKWYPKTVSKIDSKTLEFSSALIRLASQVNSSFLW
jgi:hypothetical protein